MNVRAGSMNAGASVAAGASRLRDGLTLAVLLSSAPCMALMFVVVAPVLPSLAAHYGAGADSAFVAQMLMTLPGIGIIVGGPTTGWLVERIGIRRTLCGCLLLFSVAGTAGLLVDDTPLMLAWRFLLGWSAAGVGSSTMTLIGQRYAGETRARILGYQNAAGAGLGLLGLLAAGAIAEVAGWRAPFTLYLLGAVVFVLALACIPPTPPVARRDARESIRALTGLWRLYLVMMLVYAAVFMNAVQIGFLLSADGVTSPALQSWVMATSSIATVIGAAAFGRVRHYLGTRVTFACCLVLMAAGFLVIGSSHDAPVTAIGCGLSGLGGGAAGPCLASVLLDRASPEVRGRAAGFMITVIYLGDFANPWFVTPLRAALGIHGAFVVVGCLLAAGAVLAAWRGPGDRA